MKNNYLVLSMLRRLEQEKDKLGRNKFAVPANPSFFSAGGSRRTDGEQIENPAASQPVCSLVHTRYPRAGRVLDVFARVTDSP